MEVDAEWFGEREGECSDEEELDEEKPVADDGAEE